MATSTTPSRSAHSGPLNSGGFIVRALITLLSAALIGALIAAPSALAQSRGELLYQTHCMACHTTEVHWRDQRSANHWAGLKLQVRRWQAAASLSWGDADIQAVSRWLNDSVYHFEQTADPLVRLGPAGQVAVSALTPLAPHRIP
jgi:mono/diheme cytochrome c family protein